MTRSRLLILLIVLLGVALVYAWWAMPRQQRIDSAARQVMKPRAAQQQVVTAPEVKDLDFSSTEKNKYRAPKKSLFGPLFPPPKKKVVKAAKPKPKVVKPVIQPQPVKRVVQAPKPAGPPPMRPLTFLGHLKKGDEMTVFLADDKGEIHLVKKGERFGDGLEVANLTAKEVIVRNLKTGQQVTQQIRTDKSQRLPRTNFKSGRPSSAIPKAVPAKPANVAPQEK